MSDESQFTCNYLSQDQTLEKDTSKFQVILDVAKLGYSDLGSKIKLNNSKQKCKKE